MTLQMPPLPRPTKREPELSPRFKFQIQMLEKGAEELHRNIGRIDDVLFKIKASGITVWVAMIGWGFSAESQRLIPLGAVVILGFWLLEGFFRGIQARYLAASMKLTHFLNDRDELDGCFRTQELPRDVIYPLAFRETEVTKLKMYVKGILAPGVSTLYLFLTVLNGFLWMASG